MTEQERKASDVGEPVELPLSAVVAQCLVDNHRAFLGFLESRVGDRALAEDILQDAFVRGTERAQQLQREESVLAWCSRLLRNAVIDHHRRHARRAQRLEVLARELDGSATQPELADAICRCVDSLVSTLKPESASALRRIDVEGASVKDYAAEVGITTNHAGVLVHRARRALRERLTKSCGTCAAHGCLDCTCGGGEWS